MSEKNPKLRVGTMVDKNPKVASMEGKIQKLNVSTTDQKVQNDSKNQKVKAATVDDQTEKTGPMEGKNQKVDTKDNDGPEVDSSKLKVIVTNEDKEVDTKDNDGPEVDSSKLKVIVTNEDKESRSKITRTYDAVKNVTNKKEIWKLGVIIDDMWSVYKGDTESSIELLLRDDKGDIIQATIIGGEIGNWKSKLSGGQTYYMRNFRVAVNDSAYKMTPHQFRLTFVGGTRVEEDHLPQIPVTSFNFKDFAEIHAGNYVPDLLVDVIGVINSIGKSITPSSTRKGNIAFTLKDQRDKIMDCTLWNSYAVQFMEYYNNITHAGPVVIILRHSRVREAQGNFPLQLTNVWDGTKLIFDQSMTEIKAFLNSLPKDVTFSTQPSVVSNSSQYYSQYSGGSQYNSDEHFIKKATFISLGDMKKLKQDTICVTVVTTSHIRVSNHGWYFLACHECPRKVENQGEFYECNQGHKTTAPLIKYKIDVEVYDDADQIGKFVFWDNTLDELLGMTAEALLKLEKTNGRGDAQDYPDIIDHIMNRRLAFRVKWTPGYGGQASVVMCKDCPLLVAKICEHLPVAESSMNEIESVIPMEEDIIPTLSESSIQAYTQAEIDKFSSLDESILSTPIKAASASAENDLSLSAQKTPGKRCALKQPLGDQAQPDSQMSSTRSGRLIKKEKM